jgi:YegS/Rv2252/BmrU family lipid kinase
MCLAVVCIIYNPRAGRGQAERKLRSVRRLLGQHAEFRPTSAPGDAEEIAAGAARERFPIVAAAGGDGTVHEVANGLLRQAGHSTALAVLPLGSANDYAHSLGLGSDWWRKPDPAIGSRYVDVGQIRTEGRARYFINCMGLGFNGFVTREARKIKSLRGMPLYGLAMLRAMRSSYRFPVLAIRIDDGAEQRVPTLALTFGLGQREGNFPLFPQAILDDGLFDYLHVGRLPRLRLLKYLPRMISGNIPQNDPLIGVGRCKKMEIVSETGLMAHGDGEFFCEPEEGITRLEVELLPGRMRVLGRLESIQNSSASGQPRG